jgi:hypothetical protein
LEPRKQIKKLTIDMKKKKHLQKNFNPMSAVVYGCALAAVGAHAQTTPIFSESFPASWSGTGTTVTDQSAAGDTGFLSGTGATYTTTAVPPGAAPGTGSLALTGTSGTKVTPPGTFTTTTGLLNNAAVAADGGFTYNIDFMWNGTDSSSFGHIEKLIDYAGTESLQLVTTTGAAALEMTFTGDTGAASTIPVTTTIAPNTWYNVTLAFNTAGNSLVAGDISGVASLYVNGSLVSSGAATKGTYGDSLARPIGIGEFGYGHTTSIIGFNGDIYDASVALGVPEPSTLALALMGGLSTLGTMWKARRKA